MKNKNELVASLKQINELCGTVNQVTSIETRYKQLLEVFAELIEAYDTPGPVMDQAVKKAKWILAYEDEQSKDSLGSPQNSNP